MKSGLAIAQREVVLLYGSCRRECRLRLSVWLLFRVIRGGGSQTRVYNGGVEIKVGGMYVTSITSMR